MLKCDKCSQKYLPTILNAGNCPACISRTESRKAIESLRLEEATSIAARQTPFLRITGIYFLLRKDRVVYVGKSTNILGRICKHTYNFDGYSYIECAKEELDLYEVAYITKFKPRYNTNHNRPVKMPARICSITT